MSYQNTSSLESALAGAAVAIVFGLLSPFLLAWTAIVLVIEAFFALVEFFSPAAVES